MAMDLPSVNKTLQAGKSTWNPGFTVYNRKSIYSINWEIIFRCHIWLPENIYIYLFSIRTSYKSGEYIKGNSMGIQWDVSNFSIGWSMGVPNPPVYFTNRTWLMHWCKLYSIGVIPTCLITEQLYFIPTYGAICYYQHIMVFFLFNNLWHHMWTWLALLLQLTKKTNLNPVGKFNVTDACSTYIYPNTEGNIGVKKCETPRSLRLKKSYTIYIYVQIDNTYIYI
jgi:hypothetical protein